MRTVGQDSLCACVCSHSHGHIQEGEREEVKGADYIREEAVRYHFEHLFCEKKMPVLEVLLQPMLGLINPLGPRRRNIRACRTTTGGYIRTLTMMNAQAAMPTACC